MREADAMSDTEIRKSVWSTSQRLIRKQLALLAARASAGALRFFKLGQGQSLPGKIALKIDPEILSELVRTIDVVLVSGTNGKTTTTALLASGLERSGPTVTNAGGSNMTGGVVSALIDGSGSHSMASFAALEVDEIYLTPVARAIKPKAIILLNLSRDQLDRMQEVRKIAAKWKSLLSELPGVKVVANADDPLVVFAASEVPDVTWVAGGIS
jgi:UDP-N-acetylmuramyl tripeptide synthase